MKRILLLLAVILFLTPEIQAQNILGRLGERAKQAVENNIGNKIEKGVNDVLDGKKKDKKGQEEAKEASIEAAANAEEAVEETPDAVAQNAKNDFVRGSVILFEDTMDGEQIGEFPSKWDIVDEGSLEVATVNGKKYAQFTTDYNRVTPLKIGRAHV